ncbi:MAG: hypothetical protein IKT58_01895 [Oscillospiraceae bacterium]|nr:hypothetical protein [Oscillospiraceae bacterium]
MEQENKPVEQEELQAEEVSEFEPSPKWKRVMAWILFGIMVVAIINWLVSIAYPQWPQWVLEQIR